MSNLNIDSLLTIDDTGMPQAPSIRQLVDKDIALLWQRDTTKDKRNYIAQCGIIYYLGDPKSPARQQGLSDKEALDMAIEQFDLPKDYLPDALVKKLIDKYYKQNIGEAGRTVENILKGIHNVNLSIDVINQYLNEKLKTITDADQIEKILTLVDNVNKKAGEIPNLVKKLEEAKQNLLYEKETEMARGGNIVSSSMDAENYVD